MNGGFYGSHNCDSGMIPSVLMLNGLCSSGKSLLEMVANLRAPFPSFGAINFRVADAAAVFAEVEARYRPGAEAIGRLDVLSLTFADLRMNLRAFNIEPLLCLNLARRGDRGLLAAQQDELIELIAGT